jgi:precorrin-6A/cobalt-precorrin-6A reductase
MPHLRVLVLGGTAEARELAGALPGMTVISSLAGRTTAPRLPAGETRIGGFGGAEGLADYLRAHRIDALVDATHPFAARISAHAATAADATGLPFLVLRRRATTGIACRTWPRPRPCSPGWATRCS